MKKMLNTIKYLILNIVRFIDRKIIIPITRLLLVIRDNINSDSRRFEKLLSKKNSLLFISLIMSLSVFFVVDSKSVAMLETSAEILYNQKIDIQYNEEAYVLEGVPKTVDIVLVGRRSDLYLARQIPSHEITLDLSGLKPGIHQVELKYKRVLASINYKLDPSVVTVTIHPKVSEVRTINVDLLNIDKLDPKLIIKRAETERDDVIIKGSEARLKKVSTVKALLNIDNLVNPEVGETEFKDIPLIAYDQNGNVIDVEIVPSRINANITIASPNKVVPIRVIPVGNVTFGKAISNIGVDVKEVTIYGDEAILAGITNIPIEIDVEGLKANRQYNVNIKKPVGVRHISASIANINVSVEDEITREFEDIGIEYQNLADHLSVNAKTENDRTVTVIVKGVKSVLDDIDPNSIRVYVDLKGYGPGEHEIDVIVERTDLRVTYLPKIKRVTLVIRAAR
jgi:YbbR domain-containing protein